MKDNKEGVLILLGLVIIFGLAFEPLKEASQRNKSSRSERDEGGFFSSIGESDEVKSNSEPTKTVKEIEKEIKEVSESLKEQQEKSRRSPYYNKIRLSSIYGLGSPDPSQEYVRLSVYLEKNEQINITGWYLQSEVTNYYAVIGRASLLPFPFTRNDNDVVIKDGDSVIITKGFSPIGISFRTNKCTGYFEENRTFYPGLSKRCPRISEDDLPTFSSVYDRQEECVDLITSIPRCTTRGNEYLRDLPDTVSSSCKNYIREQINYNACVAKHFGDTDFPGNEYRLYLGKFGPLWRNRSDKINLHDQNGLIVDTIEY